MCNIMQHGLPKQLASVLSQTCLGTVFICWAVLPSTQLPAQTLHTLDDIQVDAKLLSIESTEKWSFSVAEKVTKLAPARIVRWGAWSGVLDDQAVWLSDDSFICGEVNIQAAEVTVANDWLQIPTLAWNSIRGLVLIPPRTLNNWLSLSSQMQAASGEEDVVWLKDGKRLSGIVRLDDASDIQGAPTITVDSTGQTITLRLADIQAIVFSPALLGPVSKHRGATQICLLDGSRLWTTQISSSPTVSQLTLENGLLLQSIDAPEQFAGAINGIAQSAATSQFLSDLPPASYRHLPDSTLRWELGVDRDVLGAPLHTESGIFQRGLATHSSSQVAYRWDGSPVRLLAEATLAAAPAGATDRLGSVACQVLVASSGALRTVHTFQLQRPAAGSAPSVELIKLDLKDARLIVLVTDKADYGQYGDHLLWLDARLSSR